LLRALAYGNLLALENQYLQIYGKTKNHCLSETDLRLEQRRARCAPQI
jgi:hypothetical protein